MLEAFPISNGALMTLIHNREVWFKEFMVLLQQEFLGNERERRIPKAIINISDIKTF